MYVHSYVPYTCMCIVMFHIHAHAHGPWDIQLCSVSTCTCVHMEHTCTELNVLIGDSYVIVAYHRKCCGGGLGTVCV